MAKASSNVVDIRDYIKAHPSLKQDELEKLIVEQRAGLRHLDTKVINLLSRQHKLKAIQSCKDASVKLEGNLVTMSDWLEDKIAEAKNEDSTATLQAQFKKCEQLISRNERIKKNISDDMAACRYTESKKAIDPVKVGGFLVGTPSALAALANIFWSHKIQDAVHAGEAGAVIGVFLAFHHQVKDFCISAGKAVARSPRHIKLLKKEIRGSAFTTAFAVSVAVAESNGLKTNYPERNSIKPRLVITARP